MAASAFTIFSANKQFLNINALVNATVKMALIDGDSSIDDTTSGATIWADLSSREIADGNGYISGGKTLTAVLCEDFVTFVGLKSDDVTWNATGGPLPEWYFAVMYVEGTLWDLVNPLVGYFIGNLDGSIPIPVPATPTGESLALLCPAFGWFTAS